VYYMTEALPGRQLVPLFFLVVFTFLPSAVPAIEFNFLAGPVVGNQAPEVTAMHYGAGLEHSAGDFTFTWLLNADTLGLYPAPFHGDYFGNLAIDIALAGVNYTGSPWFMRLGKLPGYDIVNSPYSLFINGSGLAVPGLTFGYEDEYFLYRQQWMYLGEDSRYDWYDRGAVQKTYALKLGTFRFGFQDVAVTSHAVLDPLDFLLPAPSFLVQYVALAPGRPWSREHTEETNKNSIMGFFADYDAGSWYAYAQLLVDDLNANFIFKPDGAQNPSKLALSLGGYYDAPGRGRFGAYLAAAQKYTFEPFGHGPENAPVNYQYSYTLYPATAYEFNNAWYGIDIESSMLGYRNGENDLSFCLSWECSPWQGRGVIGPLTARSELEFSLTGSQSPGNPWHEYYYWDDPDSGYVLGEPTTSFLDDPRLRYRLRLRGNAALPFRDFTFRADYVLGYEWNRMELDTEADHVAEGGLVNGQPIWRPGSSHGLLAELRLTLMYTLRF
jgi:hypothetical protein